MYIKKNGFYRKSPGSSRVLDKRRVPDTGRVPDAGQIGCLGERCELPQRVWGGAPAEIEFDAF